MTLSGENTAKDDEPPKSLQGNTNTNTNKRPNGGNNADGKALREEKRRKWLAKQERKSQKGCKDDQREAWFRANSHFATRVSLQDLDQLHIVEEARKSVNNEDAQVDDNSLALLLEPYRNIQDKKESDPKTSFNPKGTSAPTSVRYFIAEGTETVRLLIQQQQQQQQQRMSNNLLPPINLKSVFIKTSAFFENPVNLQKDVEEACHAKNSPNEAKPPFAVLIGSEEVQSKVVGFPFCRGALACGIVPSWSEDEEWLWNYLQSHPRFQKKDKTQDHQRCPALRIVALDGVCDTANLGSVVRSASAFGVDAVVLSHDCCDCWYRRAVRVSMGHVCRIPCIRVSSLAETIKRLQDELDVVAYAAVIAGANCVLDQIERGNVPGAWCCVVGNEGNGISKDVLRTCKKRLRIAMEEGVDSLSVPVATGILLHGLKEREAKSV